MIKKIKLKDISKEISAFKTDTILVIYDENLSSLYEKKLNITGKRVIKFAVSSTCKSFEGYRKCCEFFLSKNIHPKAHLISLGGGSVSDLAGFVASTLLRGISWSTIPTTLLAMIDAAIGGKVAIDTPVGKNLLGNIHHPQNIWIDSSFLQTLPKEEFKSACGELIKYAFLNKKIAQLIIKKASLEQIIYTSATYKEQVVCEDEREKNNKRLILNFGHTLGHALEMYYKLPHGRAIFWGIPLELKLTGREYLIKDWLNLAKVLSFDPKDFIPPWKDGNILEIWNYVKRDKKRIEQDQIRLVDVKEIGISQIVNFKLDTLKKEIGRHHFANII